MPEYLTPGVYFELMDAAPAIRGARTDITGFVGMAERGPLNQPVQIQSWRQFQSRFGSFTLYSFLAYAVKGFFENDGRTCFVTRVAGHSAARAARTLKNAAGDEVIVLSAQDEGVWGNKIAVALQARPSVSEFSLQVTREGRGRESFPRLSTDPADKRYFARIINEGDYRTARSQWISAAVVLNLPPGADLLPDAEQSGLASGSGFLSGGADGVASVTMKDFLGDADSLNKQPRGLSTFETLDPVGIVCMPDIHIQPVLLQSTAPPHEEPPGDPCLASKPSPPAAAPVDQEQPEQPPSFTQEEIALAQRSMIEHCERLKDRVAILDAPVKPGGGTAITVNEVQQWRQRFDSARGYAALYYPWVKVVDPLRSGGSNVKAVPPCGHIAGLYARTDFAVGAHKAPANERLFWAEDVTVSINDEVQGVLNPQGVNCIRAFAGRGIRVYGARTLSSDPDWRYINVRKLLLMIEEAIDEATQWAVFEPHNFALRQLLVLSISGFLDSLWRRGALAGASAREAFYIKCDDTNNPQASVDQGKIITEIGVAPTRPAEFIVFRIGRTVEELEIVER